ncbi:MAG: STAS domain-containing protein [Planctomycetota bacterium]|nr:STAS domain-containing protein [Planctomycetota bacterium]
MARVDNSSLVIQRVGQMLFVELPEGSLVNRSDLERVSGAIDQLIETTEKPQIVLNFVNVKHVSSTFLGRLIAFHKKAKAREGQLALFNVSPPLNELFTLTKLSSQIPIFKPGEKPLPATIAWVSMFSVATGSGVMGMLFILFLALKGFPSRGGSADGLVAGAMFWFILCIPVAVAIYFYRRVIVQVGHDLQWIAVGLLAAISVTMFLLFILAR